MCEDEGGRPWRGPAGRNHHHLPPSVADDGEYARGFAAGWADHAAYVRQTGATWERGFTAGWAAASRAVNNAIAEAAQGMPATAAEVVASMIRTGDWPARRAAADTPGPRPGDHPGGAVQWERAA